MTPTEHAKAIEDAARKVTQASIDYMVDSGLAYKLGRAEEALQSATRAGVGAAPAAPDVAAELEEVKTVCAEAYQVVGALLADAGRFDSPEGQKIMDNLSTQRLEHTDVLPWKSQAPPEGWQLVPVVPTREMMLAATEIEVDCDAGGAQTIYGGEAMDIYRTMLSAAPKP